MKLLIATFLTIFATSAFAAKGNKSCDTYMIAAYGDASGAVRLELGFTALNSVAELNFTPAEQAKLLSSAKKFIAEYPKQQDAFEGLFYFACTTDLSTEEKDQVKEQMLELMKR